MHRPASLPYQVVEIVRHHETEVAIASPSLAIDTAVAISIDC
jgi:hypothetical protein